MFVIKVGVIKMNDNERIEISDSCYVAMAIRRTKENHNLQERVIRRIIRDEERDLEDLRHIIKTYDGVWRIYRSVNKRSFKKALKLFKHALIDNEEDFIFRLDSLWKKCLMNPKARADKKFLLDIDDKARVNEVKEFLKEQNLDILEETPTVNGHHIIVKPFDIRLLNIPDVDLIKDGLIFIEKVKK